MPTKQKEVIGGSQDWFVCLCGNEPDSDGFESCLKDGTIIEPTLDSKWDVEYACTRCNRIIDGQTLEVVGVCSEKVAHHNAHYWDN